MKKFALMVTLLFSIWPVWSSDSCIPYLECKPLTTKALSGPVGTHLFWFVRNANGGIDHHGFSCLKDVCDLQKFKDIANDVLIGKVTPRQTWAANMTFECDYSKWGVIEGEIPVCAERKIALVTQKAEWLVGIKSQLDWKVKPLAGSTTRPVYRVIDGTMSSTVFSRVSVGLPCQRNTLSFPSGNDKFMPVVALGNIPVVALCSLETE